MSYRVALRAAPAPFPLGSYRLVDHQLKEKMKKTKTNLKQVYYYYYYFFKEKASMLKQPHADTSRRMDYRLHRDRTSRRGGKTLILLSCLCGKTSPTLVNKRPRGRQTGGERFMPCRKAKTAILMLVYELKLGKCACTGVRAHILAKPCALLAARGRRRSSITLTHRCC